MKRRLVLPAILFAMNAGASAADLPSLQGATIIPSPPTAWSGFYAGLNAGYNFGANSNVYSQNWPVWSGGGIVLEPSSMDGVTSNNQSGFMGGAQVGYNYQLGSGFLVGLETDIQGASAQGASRTLGGIRQSESIVVGPALITGEISAIGSTSIRAGLDYLGTVRGRFGCLWNPTLLLYGTGGFAYGGAWANVTQSSLTAANASINVLNILIGSGGASTIRIGGAQQNQLLTGWTAGGGLEWMFTPNWSLKAEALYWDLGRMNIGTTTYSDMYPTWGRSSVNYSGVTARAGVNYHFDWGSSAPVVGRY